MIMETPMSEHDEIGELLPGYALGCLDAEDEAAARAHLEECASCREELASLRGLVGDLAAALPASRPPADLEARILAAAREERPAMGPRPSRRRSRGPSATPIRSRRRPLLAIAAAAAILILGAGDILQWQLARPKGLTTLAFSGRGGSPTPFGTLVLDPEDNEGVLAVRDLPPLDGSRRYQLWLAKGSLRASGGQFSVDARGYGSLILDVPSDFKGFDSFLITVESAQGGAAPTGRSVMEGKR
jgi:anti-sigma-K factor RskA